MENARRISRNFYIALKLNRIYFDVEEVMRETQKIEKNDLQAARNYAAKIDDSIADHAFNEDFGFATHVTEEDKQKYVDRHRKLANEIRFGKYDSNFTVWQRMHFFLTEECVPFFPKD